jgi:hypothetical protein
MILQIVVAERVGGANGSGGMTGRITFSNLETYLLFARTQIRPGNPRSGEQQLRRIKIVF